HILAQDAADLETVQDGQKNVEDDQVRVHTPRGFDGRQAIGCDLYGAALQGQIVGQRFLKSLFVFDNKDYFGHASLACGLICPGTRGLYLTGNMRAGAACSRDAFLEPFAAMRSALRSARPMGLSGKIKQIFHSWKEGGTGEGGNMTEDHRRLFE